MWKDRKPQILPQPIVSLCDIFGEARTTAHRNLWLWQCQLLTIDLKYFSIIFSQDDHDVQIGLYLHENWPE